MAQISRQSSMNDAETVKLIHKTFPWWFFLINEINVIIL